MIKAYHFLQADMTAGSGNERPWEVGETRTIKDPSKIALCKYGYHSSPTLWDALHYAPGPVACLVEISKPIQSNGSDGDRKSVSAKRKLIKTVNIDRELRLFACDCAERDQPNNKRPRKAIEVARRFANGQATQEELTAAWDAARDAARDAAWDAAWNAARNAVRDAAWDAEAKWQRGHFEEMFGSIFD